MRRRDFFTACAALPLLRSTGHASSPFTVKYRQEPPYRAALRFAEPGSDEFPAEKTAVEIEARLASALTAGDLPVAVDCTGSSPAPSRYRSVAVDVGVAIFEDSGDPASGWRKWRASLGAVRRAVFYSLPGDLVRYDIRSRNAGRLEHRVGVWKFGWKDGAVTHLEPVEETLTWSERPWFRDVTAAAFADDASFRDQLTRGVPYWRARLDPACGIDVYGENGIAVADIDGDGLDEIYVCQPGGLPNRLYHNDGNGHFRDVSKEFGLDILDDTACALFVDLRNSGHQDLVLVRPTQPMLFLNDGKGRFTPLPDAFRFRTAPARHLHRRLRGGLRSRRPPGPLLLHLRLLPKRSAVPLSRALSRRAQRPAELPLPQLPRSRPGFFEDVTAVERHRTTTTIASASPAPGATITATAGPISTSPTISAARISTATPKAASTTWQKRPESTTSAPA